MGAAGAAGVSARTAAKWVVRYRRERRVLVGSQLGAPPGFITAPEDDRGDRRAAAVAVHRPGDRRAAGEAALDGLRDSSLGSGWASSAGSGWSLRDATSAPVRASGLTWTPKSSVGAHGRTIAFLAAKARAVITASPITKPGSSFTWGST